MQNDGGMNKVGRLIDITCPNRLFTAAPPLQVELKFAKDKLLKQLRTCPRMANHASNLMNVFKFRYPIMFEIY